MRSRRKPTELKLVQLGKVGFHNFIAYALPNPRAYDTGEDGIVGPAFLDLFDVYFDYANAKAYFIFNQTFDSAKD